MAKIDTSGNRRRSMTKGLAVGVGILVGSLAGWGEGWAQGSASRGMPAPSGSVQPGGQVSVPSYQRQYDRDGHRDRDRDRDHDRDRNRHWGDRHGHVGYYSKHYPGYGYYYYPPYGTYPGRWVWDGRNWLFVPLY
jgi:hypothetical protein